MKTRFASYRSFTFRPTAELAARFQRAMDFLVEKGYEKRSGVHAILTAALTRQLIALEKRHNAGKPFPLRTNDGHPPRPPNRQKTCARCGRRGHNASTCGKEAVAT